MLIKNFRKLATSPSRKKALKIIDAGINAVLPKNAIRGQVKLKGSILSIQKKTFNLKNYQKIYVVGFGKASIACAQELERILGNKIAGGVVLDVSSAKLKRIKVRKCTHPVVSAQNVKHTKELLALLDKATQDDMVICLISGGGSAILADPAVPLPQYIRMNKALLRSGANIHEMNTIRKHLSHLKGDQLPHYLNGSECVCLILSDVVGDDLSFIASGPTVPDKTTVATAKAIVRKYNLPKLPLHETPKKPYRNVTNILLLSNTTAAAAMAAQARRLGLKPHILSTHLKGEARDVGSSLAKKARKGIALIAAGETTVTVHGHGKGGRNQELCLGALRNIGNAVVLSAGTDGIDNTPAAGGIVDKSTLKKAPDFNPYLQNNDAFNYLKKANGLIITGKTGTNVADIMLVLKD